MVLHSDVHRLLATLRRHPRTCLSYAMLALCVAVCLRTNTLPCLHPVVLRLLQWHNCIFFCMP